MLHRGKEKDNAMIFWLVIAILAAIGEVLTLTLFLATASAAAVVTALISVGLHSLPLQLGIFAVLSLVGITVIRPLLVRTLGIESVSHPVGPSVQAHIVGRRGVVTRPVDDHSGQVRIGHSEFWSARTYESNQSLEVGTPVEVMLVEGLNALVAPAPQLVSSQSETQPSIDIPQDKGA
jgi:membrane protein implicated in regulation of membrane protease activity